MTAIVYCCDCGAFCVETTEENATHIGSNCLCESCFDQDLARHREENAK